MHPVFLASCLLDAIQPNEPGMQIMRTNAQGLVTLGFTALGYKTVTTDCGWASPNRTADGQITWRPKLFPSGFPALGEFLHGLGLEFGVYSGAGVWECDVDNGQWHLQASLGEGAGSSSLIRTAKRQC